MATKRKTLADNLRLLNTMLGRNLMSAQTDREIQDAVGAIEDFIDEIQNDINGGIIR